MMLYLPDLNHWEYKSQNFVYFFLKYNITEPISAAFSFFGILQNVKQNQS